MTTTPIKPAAVPAKRKPGRPATGQTPPAERKRLSRLRLAKERGRRLDIQLDADGVEHLGEVHKDNPGMNDTEAVHLALRWYALRRSRKPNK